MTKTELELRKCNERDYRQITNLWEGIDDAQLEMNELLIEIERNRREIAILEEDIKWRMIVIDSLHDGENNEAATDDGQVILTKVVDYKKIDGGIVEIKKKFTGSTKEEAENQYMRWKVEQEMVKAVPFNPHRTFGETASYYVKNVLLINTQYTIGERALYEGAYLRYVKDSQLSDIKMCDVTIEDIRNFCEHLAISALAKENVRIFLADFLEWAEDEGFCPIITETQDGDKLI